jgi:hypothetical protein
LKRDACGIHERLLSQWPRLMEKYYWKIVRAKEEER